MVETIGDQQVKMGVTGHEAKTETPPLPIAPTEPLTPGQHFALPDIGQAQEAAGRTGWFAKVIKKLKS